MGAIHLDVLREKDFSPFFVWAIAFFFLGVDISVRGGSKGASMCLFINIMEISFLYVIFT